MLRFGIWTVACFKH